MRRLVVAILLCLMLGLLTSIAVAWTAAWFFRTDPKESQGTWLNDKWYISVQDSAFLTYTLTYEKIWTLLETPIDHGVDPNLIVPVQAVQDELMLSERGVAETLSAGWPMRCVYYTRKTTDFRYVVTWDYENYGVLICGDPFASRQLAPSDFRVMPVALYWPGLALDALTIFAVLGAFGLLIYTNRLQRARARHRRGQCMFCSYKLHNETSFCPECGIPTSNRIPMIGRFIIAPLVVACIALAAACGGFLLLVWAHDPTPMLHKAAYRGNVQVVSELLNAGADPNELLVVESNGTRINKLTPLVAATIGCNLDTVRALLDAGADPTYRINGTYGALNAAIGFRCYECARALLEAGVDPNIGPNDWTTALLFPAADGDQAAIELLLEFGAQPSRDELALSLAIRMKHHKVMKFLLEHGAEPNFRAMETAVHAGDEQIFDALLECGGDPLATSDSGATLLFTLASYEPVRNSQLWQRLVDAGIDVNAQKYNGQTALALAASDSDDSFATLFLLRNGADPNIAASSSIETPLYQAVLYDRRLNVIFLLAYGADPTVMEDVTWKSRDPVINELIADAIERWKNLEGDVSPSP